MAVPVITVSPGQRRRMEANGQVLFRILIYFTQLPPLQDVGYNTTPPPQVADSDAEEDEDFQVDDGDSPLPGSSPLSFSFSTFPEGFNNEQCREIGAALNQLAEVFNTRYGSRMVDRANQVDLRSITFIHERDRYRAVAFLWFCCDVLIHFVKSQVRVAQEFLQNVCDWISEHGGWGRIFGSFYNVAKVAALVIFNACGIVYLKNNCT